MKATDRTVLLGLAVVGLIAVFWFMVLSPKRAEVSKLDDEVTQLRSDVAEQEQLAAAGEQARHSYDSNYHDLVVLGKAVPQDEDTSSLLIELQSISDRADVQFRGITLQDSVADAPEAPPPPTEGTAPSGGPTDSTTTTSDSTTTTSTAATPAVATEASAAALPIGASVGPAGLPVMPYTVDFRGGFFQIADFFEGLDDSVHTRGKGVAVDGRLMTIDGFDLKADARSGFPKLGATIAITTYVTPADQGLLAGASPSAPAPTTPEATPTPASSATAPSSSTPTATSTAPTP